MWDAQEHAFTTLLSQKLFDWMMKDTTTQIPAGMTKDGIIATRDILVTPSATIHLALEDNGIAPINIADVDENIPLELDSPSTPRGEAENEYPGSSLGYEDDNDADNLDAPASSTHEPTLRAIHCSCFEPKCSLRAAKTSYEVRGSLCVAIIIAISDTYLTGTICVGSTKVHRTFGQSYFLGERDYFSEQ